MITAAKAAEMAGIDRTTLYRATKRGEIEKKYVGGQWPRYVHSDLIEWMSRKKGQK